MKSTGIVRKTDEMGRIVLPKELRNILMMDIKDSLEISLEEDSIILKKYIEKCVLCGESKNTESYKDKLICRTCITNLFKY